MIARIPLRLVCVPVPEELHQKLVELSEERRVPLAELCLTELRAAVLDAEDTRMEPMFDRLAMGV